MQRIQQHDEAGIKPAQRRRFWRCADLATLREHQLKRLNRLLADAVVQQPFYRDKYRDVQLPLRSLDELARLPLLEKPELTSAGAATIS